MADRLRFAPDLTTQLEGPNPVQVSQKEAHDWYNSADWKRVRARVLARDKKLCQVCLTRGRTTLANMVHHKLKRIEYPHLAYTESNLVSLCWGCHAKLDHASR
ncbi:HNH endonuclease [Paludisphaera borealis]|uniref:Putative HNH nuclease YajD n=1 Tax=Paludisphaera borealis TaxID=1387353 RepID=A0A1U7CX55_9BACT|nr:HNH endonuclease [Paludisphaera borealis]APW63527.1 hypothetical protein BSF38_05099 [Paludisphaera borealis]